MKLLRLIFATFLFYQTSYADVGTYNFHFNYSCSGDSESQPWFDYHLGPTLEGTPNGYCKVDPSKICHDYQQVATFYHGPEQFLPSTICDDLGMERCELITISVRRNLTNSEDLLIAERASQKRGSIEILEVQELPIKNNSTLEGSFYLPGQDCLKELRYKLIPIR